MKQYLALFSLIFVVLFVSCEPEPWDPKITANLDEVYAGQFKIGAALAMGEYSFNSISTYEDELLDVFNSYSAENCMKPSVLQPTEGNFQWTYADNLIDFAQAENAVVRGHVLVWHNQSPSWMAPAGNKTAAQENMEDHINAVMGRYSADVYAWDVVNEAISDSDSGSIYRTDSMWYQAYGDASFIQDAFDYAYAADNNAELFYNDYSVVNSGKRDRIVQMINDLELITNHHMTGIGLQAHWQLNWPSAADIETTIRTFADMGLDVHITELDINTQNAPNNSALQDQIAARYDEIFEVFRNNSDAVSSVTTWGVADDYTWLNNDSRTTYPLLFDTKHVAKKAYQAIIDF